MPFHTNVPSPITTLELFAMGYDKPHGHGIRSSTVVVLRVLSDMVIFWYSSMDYLKYCENCPSHDPGPVRWSWQQVFCSWMKWSAHRVVHGAQCRLCYWTYHHWAEIKKLDEEGERKKRKVSFSSPRYTETRLIGLFGRVIIIEVPEKNRNKDGHDR